MSYERTKWIDKVLDQFGQILRKGTPLSARNMNNIEDGVDTSLNTGGAILGEVCNQVNSLKKEQDKNLNQRFQQGIAYLYNKYVEEGCTLTKMANSRYLAISRTANYVAGDVSKIYVDGKKILINDEQTVMMIPQNNTSVLKVFFIYIDFFDNKYKLNISEIQPVDKLILYTATVLAGDLRPDLNTVILTDLRKINSNKYMRNSDPYTIVSFPGYPMLDTDYGIIVNVDEATDILRVGNIQVYDKQLNGFKIKITGDADNIKLRWSLVNPNIA